MGIAEMDLDLKKVAAFMRKTTDEDLLDRVTVYRDQMEPAALDLFEGELSRRGIDDTVIAEHGADFRSDALENPDGTIARCSFCGRPAVVQGRGWHRLWRRIPLFPRIFAYCRSHAPAPEPSAS